MKYVFCSSGNILDADYLAGYIKRDVIFACQLDHATLFQPRITRTHLLVLATGVAKMPSAIKGLESCVPCDI